MSKKSRQKLKRQEVIAHRKMVYESALDRVLTGEVKPEYVSERWRKLQEVKK